MRIKRFLSKYFSPGQIVLNLFMLFLTLTMLVPMLNIVARSLSDPAFSPTMSGLRIIPRGFSLINYRIIFNHPVLLRSIWNSSFIAIVGTIINIVFTATAAYVLIQPGLLFKKAIMVFLIVMMLFDPGLVPEYLTIRNLGLIGSPWSVILVTSVNVYYLFIMIRYFEAIPAEMYDAAKIDGAGHIRTLVSIVFPLAQSGIATITMFYAVIRWNEYFKASIYLTQQSKTTLQVILRQFVVLGDTVSLVGAQNILDYNEIARIDYNALKNATIVVAILPILVIYPFVLRFYTKDVMAGSIKG